ncbi:MAG: type II toxin-antitoxin system VapC family toxin [Thermoproteota archaeon]|nr:type II toxin-antitoxin system VapC family toxin [Candidatus Brockarchaeota archaeon]
MIYLRYSEDDKVFDYVTNLLKEAVERKDLLFVNMLVINETIWILNKKYRIPLSEIIELIDRLIPLLEIIPIDYGDYDIMKKIMLDYGLKPSDALHIASMNKMGIRHIVSEDKEFDKIPFIERMWLDDH